MKCATLLFQCHRLNPAAASSTCHRHPVSDLALYSVASTFCRETHKRFCTPDLCEEKSKNSFACHQIELVKGYRDRIRFARRISLTSLSADDWLLWSSTVGWAVWWSTCVGVDWLLSDGTDTAVLWLLVCVELLTGLEAETGVLLTGGCCFFRNASYGEEKMNFIRYRWLIGDVRSMTNLKANWT